MSGKKKLSGKVSRVDLEGGYYTLTTARGEVYKIEGGGADLLRKGVVAEVEGFVDEAGFGIGFGTPVLRVLSYRIKPVQEAGVKR